AERGEEPQALAARFADEFHNDVAALACLAPTVEPRVTDHIAEIIRLVEELVARGVAYPIPGAPPKDGGAAGPGRSGVYFGVAGYAAYGQLSGQPLDQLAVGARVEVDERKRSPLDFALWKAAKPGEPSWPSPWGPGRPGWHIECSAMATRYLGERFDLHG